MRSVHRLPHAWHRLHQAQDPRGSNIGQAVPRKSWSADLPRQRHGWTVLTSIFQLSSQEPMLSWLVFGPPAPTPVRVKGEVRGEVTHLRPGHAGKEPLRGPKREPGGQKGCAPENGTKHRLECHFIGSFTFKPLFG